MRTSRQTSKKKLYVELPDGYHRSNHQVGRLQKAMYDLVHAGLLCSKTFGTELKAKGLGSYQEDPCVFRRQRRGNTVMIVVYADILLSTATKEDEKQAQGDLQSGYPIRDSAESRTTFLATPLAIERRGRQGSINTDTRRLWLTASRSGNLASYPSHRRQLCCPHGRTPDGS